MILAAPLAVTAQEAERVVVRSAASLVGQATGADQTRAEITASADLFADVLLGPTVLHVYVEGGTTPRRHGVSTRVPFANMDAGTAVGSRGNGRIQLSELRLAWSVGERTVVHAGLMDLTGFLDVSRISNDENLYFLAQPFVNNPTIAFPDYTLGGALLTSLEALPAGRLTFSVASSHGIADSPEASYARLLDLDDPEKGVFLAGRFAWEEGHWRGSLGAWGSTGNRVESDPAGQPLPDRGLFSVLGWAGDVHSLDGRFGVARGHDDSEVFIGVTWLGTLASNAVGIGVARTPGLPHFVDRVGAHAEAFVRRSVWHTVYLTSSVQWLSQDLLPDLTKDDGLWIFGVWISAIM